MMAALTCSILSLITCRILCFLVSGVLFWCRLFFLLGCFLGFTSTVKKKKNNNNEEIGLKHQTVLIVGHKQNLRFSMLIFSGYSPSDSADPPVFRLQKMEVVEACRGRNLSRRSGLSLLFILSPVIFFLSTFLFIFLKKSGISTSLLSHSPWHCRETQKES